MPTILCCQEGSTQGDILNVASSYLKLSCHESKVNIVPKWCLYGEYALKLLLSLAVPCGVIYYRKLLFDLDPLGFVVGLSTVFIAICVEGLRGVFKETR